MKIKVFSIPPPLPADAPEYRPLLVLTSSRTIEDELAFQDKPRNKEKMLFFFILEKLSFKIDSGT